MPPSPVKHTEITGSYADGRLAAVKRVESSKAFEKSPRIRELFTFVATRSMEGAAESLTEYEIGRAVFQRNDAYIPTEDSIVRSSVRQLRRKLAEYYDTEGRDDAWVIEIPKGSYVATFTSRETLTVAATKPFPWRFGLGLALAASLVLNAFLLLRAPTAARSTAPNLTGSLVMASPEPTQFVTDDYAFVLLARLSHRQVPLDDYINQAYKERPPDFNDPRLTSLWDLLSTRYLVSMGAAGSVDRVVRAVPDTQKLIVRHARNLAGRDFQQGNVILYGAMPNNPWSQLFEERLNFKLVRRAEVALFSNTSPRPGEQAEYATYQSSHINSGQGYARLAYLPAQSGHGFVLLLSGLNMVTSEAAAEYATNPKYLPEMVKLLGAPDAAHLPHFEILLRTSAFDSTPKDMSPVAFRRLD